VAFSPDGGRVLSGNFDNTIKLWDAATGALIRTFEGHSSPVTSVAFSPDGSRVLSATSGSVLLPTGDLIGNDNTIKLWDAATGSLIRTFEGHSVPVTSVAFSPDGSRVLSGSQDRTIKLWDAATGALIRTFEGHSARVASVAFSADGGRVLSGSWDGTVRIWNTATGERLVSLIGGRDGEWLAITPEDFFAASPGGGKLLIIVRGLDVLSIDQFYQVLYHPDLVQEKLAGDPNGKVREAAAKVDLAKLLDAAATGGSGHR
jgi:WD40 repeat protein